MEAQVEELKTKIEEAKKKRSELEAELKTQKEKKDKLEKKSKTKRGGKLDPKDAFELKYAEETANKKQEELFKLLESEDGPVKLEAQMRTMKYNAEKLK